MSRRRVLFVGACIVCLLVLTLTLPAADPRLDAPGVDGDEAGAWTPVTGESSSADDEQAESTRDAGEDEGPTWDVGNLSVGDGAQPGINVSGELVPGNGVLVEPVNVDGPADSVYVDGRFVGEGRTVVTVPFAEEMTVSLRDAEVERTVDVRTDATIELDEPVVQNREVQATLTIDEEPISNVRVTRDGTPVGETSNDGVLGVEMPERAGPVELRAQRGPVDATKTVQLPEPQVSFNSLVLLPGVPAPVQVTANGEPVPEATVSVLGAGEATTGENGIARIGLPIDNRATAVLQMEGVESSAVAGRLYARLTAIIFVPLGLAGGIAYTYLTFVARAGRNSGTEIDAGRRGRGTLTELFVWFGDFLSKLAALFRVPDLRLPRLSLFGGGGLTVPSVSGLVPSLPRPRVPNLGSVLPGASAGSSSSSTLSRLSPFGSHEEEDGPDQPEPSLAAEPLGPDQPESEVRALWHAFLDRLGVRRRETKTPGQVARRALVAGFPARQVRRLLRVFRQAEYGDDEPSDEQIEQARSAATDLVSHEPTEGEE